MYVQTKSRLFSKLCTNLSCPPKEFDAFPEEGSALYNEVQTFLGASYIYPPTVFTMLGDLLASRLHSAFWFWGTAVSNISYIFVRCYSDATRRAGRNPNDVGYPESIKAEAHR